MKTESKEENFEFKVAKFDLAKLIGFLEKFPNGSWVDGEIHYPDKAKGVSSEIGYLITSMRPELMVVSKSSIKVPEDSSLYKDYLEVLGKAKRPGFLQLLSAGFDAPGQLDLAKKMAGQFVSNGGIGYVKFVFSEQAYCRDKIPAYCEVKISQDGTSLVRWGLNPEYGGEPRTLSVALTKFHSLGFVRVENSVVAFT